MAHRRNIVDANLEISVGTAGTCLHVIADVLVVMEPFFELVVQGVMVVVECRVYVWWWVGWRGSTVHSPLPYHDMCVWVWYWIQLRQESGGSTRGGDFMWS